MPACGTPDVNHAAMNTVTGRRVTPTGYGRAARERVYMPPIVPPYGIYGGGASLSLLLTGYTDSSHSRVHRLLLSVTAGLLLSVTAGLLLSVRAGLCL